MGHFSGVGTRLSYIAILAACKLIHAEARPVLYSKNTFGADTFDALTYLPPDALSHLRSVVLAIPRNSICVSEWISLLKTLPFYTSGKSLIYTLPSPCVCKWSSDL